MSKQQILAEALALDAKEREVLAEELWLSVDFSDRQAINEAWQQEIERRLAAYERGEMTADDPDEMFRRLREKYSR